MKITDTVEIVVNVFVNWKNETCKSSTKCREERAVRKAQRFIPTVFHPLSVLFPSL